MSDDRYRPGRDFLFDWAAALQRVLRTPPRKGRVRSLLHLHALAATQRCRAVAELHRPQTIDSAAALARTVIEIAYSAGYIGVAPKSRREHRAQRFTSFMNVQAQAFMEWRKDFGLRPQPGTEMEFAGKVAEATRLFGNLHSDLRSGWWGRLEARRGILSELETAMQPTVARLRRAYTILSFHIHPTPWGLASSIRWGGAGLAYTMGVAQTAGLSALLTVEFYAAHVERDLKVPSMYALMAKHFGWPENPDADEEDEDDAESSR